MPAGTPGATPPAGRGRAPGLRERVRAAVGRTTPPAADVAVVSKGDPEFVRLDGRTGRHIPQDDAGGYAGYYPADGADAVARLEAAGAAYLAIPSTAFWWLD